MKNIDEIKKEIKFSIESKKIDGFIENDSLLICCPKGTSAFIYISISTIILISITLLYFIFDFDSFYMRCIIICYFFSIFLPYLIIKDFLVFDYNNNQFYINSKILNISIGYFFYIPISNILEIGINNIYEPNNNKKSLFEKENEETMLNKDFASAMVYLDRNGKIKKITENIMNKNEINNKLLLENYINYCQLIGNLLEIPTKICQKNQKLEVINKDNINFSLNIIPIDIKEEKRERLKLNLKLVVLRFILTAFIPLELIFIKEHGLIGSFYAWLEIFKYLFFKFIPEILGLK